MSTELSATAAKAARRAKRASRPAAVVQPGFNPSESPIGWLRRRKDKDGRPLISAAEFEAGERLRADFTFAQLMPSITSSWSPATGASDARTSPGAGVELLDNVLAARDRVRVAVTAVGPELSGILIDVCCHLKGLETMETDQGWPLRSAKVVLQLALQRLARHYGLLAVAPLKAAGPARVRHWAVDGDRPGLAPSAADTSPSPEQSSRKSQRQ